MTRALRVIFAGTPDFARTALEQLLVAGHKVPLVLTQPDRPAGRGLRLQASPVKQLAQAHAIEVAQPRGLRPDGKFADDAASARAAIEAARAEVMVVAAYGLILPQWVLASMRSVGLGCLNIHASLLPRWRGAAPIHRAIEAGDARTGISIMQMDAGLDTGDVLLAETMPIGAADTTGTLQERLAALGGQLIVRALEQGAAGRLKPVPQPDEGVSYAHKITKAEAAVDWSQPAAVIERRLRAFDPSPGATSVLGNEVLKLWRGEVVQADPPAGTRPGTVLAASPEGIEVACGTGVLRLTQLQRAGGKRLAVADFLRGLRLSPGMTFARPPD